MADITTNYMDDQGQEQSIDTDALARGMAQSGYQVVGKSPDGQELTIQDEKGQFKMHVHDVLHNMGYQVKGSMPKPDSTDYGGINLEHRMAVTELPDDDAKKAYIEAKVKRQGVDNPMVIGQGRDWFYFDPDQGKYVALTHSPHWDMKSLGADMGEALPIAAHAVGAVGGGIAAGAAGLTGGPMAIPAAMAGAAGGGALAEGGIRAYLAGIDPEYRNTLSLGEQLKEIGLSAAPDAALAGGGGLLVKGAGKLFGSAGKAGVQSLLKGPVSSAAQATGEGLAGVGDIAGTVGKGVANSELAQQGLASMLPGTSTAQLAGMAGKLPEQVITAVPRVGKWLSKTNAAKSALGEEGAANLGAKASGYLEGLPMSEEAKAALRPDRFTRLQDMLRKGYEKVGLEKPVQEVAEAKNVLATAGRRGAEEANALIQNSGGMGPKNFGINPVKAEVLGAKVGNFAQKLGKAADVLDSAATGTIKGGANMVRGAGNAAYYGGKTLSTAGQLAKPFEAQAEAQLAAREFADPEIRKEFSYFSEENARRRAKQRHSDETFAYMPTRP
jgi:hypothetical protein